MDANLLRTFTTVAARGSFSLAARELGYTQSAVSQQVAALEADLGVTLLHRRPVAVTEAGARLLDHAGPLLLRLAAARTDVVRTAGSPSERLTVGTSPLAVDRLAGVLADAVAVLPRLDLRIVVVGRGAMTVGVAQGDFDLGLAVGLTAPGDPLRLPDVGPIQAVGVATDPAVVVLPDDHPLAGRPRLRLGDLADARWIDAPDAGVAAADLRTLTAGGGFRAQLRYDGTDVAGLLALVAAGHGLSALPDRVIRSAGPGARTGVAVTTPPVEFRTELVSAGRPSPAGLALVRALGG